MVNIEYSNFWGWLGLRGITYVYRVSILPASEYKIYQSFYDPYPTQRTGKSVAYIRRLISWAVSLHVLDETQQALHMSLVQPTVLNLHGLYTSTSLSGYLYGKSFNYFL
jgi:hypothetical protein